MGPETIQAIADNLGIAFDEAAQIAGDVLPSYAATHILPVAIPLLVFLLLAALAFAAATRLWIEMKKPDGICSAPLGISPCDMEEWFVFLGCASGLCLVAAAVVAMFWLPDAINWALWPDGMAAREILKAVA